jgi:cobyrinic acid a,c-diamide synthase
MGKQDVYHIQDQLFGLEKENSEVKIAVAKDEAFHFYYQENLELLEHSGAELVYFSPLHGEKLPEDVHGLYLGGGFPEQFAKELSEQKEVLHSITAGITAGLPTLAEGGGLMYLSESLEDTEHQSYSMAGIVPGQVKMQSRLAALGYRTVTGNGNNFLVGPDDTIRGHEFHYSTFEPSAELEPAYEASGRKGVKQDGVTKLNLVASYIHLHFGSAPSLAKRWVRQCEIYRSL